MRGNVLPPLPKRRKIDGDNGKAIIEVVTESACRHLRAQVLVGRSHDANVDLHTHFRSETLHHTVLKNPQELYLHCRADIADLVEEEGPAVCQFESALLVSDSPGKRPLFMSEELALQKGIRQSPRN